MKNSFIVLMVFLLFMGCGQKSSNHFNLLQGEWISDRRVDGKFLYYRFTDSLVQTSQNQKAERPYNVDGDTLIFNEHLVPNHLNLLSEKYEIVSLTNENLVLLSLMGKPTNRDTIHFKRFEVKNNIEFTHLGFESSMCFGTCPTMWLEIDNSGKTLFKGKHFASHTGDYEGKLDSEKLERIVQRVKQIDWEHLDEEYLASYTDAASYEVVVAAGGKKY